MGKPKTDDVDIDKVADDGAARLANMNGLGTSLMFPQARSPEWCAAVFDNYRGPVPSHQMAVHFMALLQRVDALMQLIDNNVGDSDDFPIEIYTENEATQSILIAHLDQVRSALGLLEEL